MKLPEHKEFSETNEKKIEKALNNNESPGPNQLFLHSLLLGNWMTDLVGLVDPVAYAKIYNFAKEAKSYMDNETLESFVEKISQEENWMLRISGEVIDLIRHFGLEKILEGSFLKLNEAVNKLCKTLMELFRGGKESDMAEFLKDFIYLFCYIKFVRPTNTKRLLPYNYYNYIFDKMFNYYSPHKHFDRWPEPKKRESKDEDSIRERAKHIDESVRYLSEVYTKLDRDWARDTCKKGIPKNDESRKEWCYNLALLGHALHTTEDFFAHTNFVERALENSTGFESSKLKRRHIYIHKRRLKEFDGHNRDAENSEAPEELLIVGGTFDHLDTFFALESALGGPISTQVKKSEIDRIWEKKPSEYTAEELWEKVVSIIDIECKITPEEAEEVIPEIVKKAIPEKVKKAILEKVKAILPDAETRIIDVILRLYDKNQITKAFNNLTILQNLRSIFETLRYILSLEWLNIVKHIKDLVEERVKEWITDSLGGTRIGSHALMNKDDDKCLHFEYAQQMAAAVDNYVLEVMLRWNSSTKPIAGVRQAIGNPQNSQLKIDSKVWVDWYQLLSFFMCHPDKIFNDVSGKDPSPFTWYDIQGKRAAKMTINGSHGHRLAYIKKDEVDKRAECEKEKQLMKDFKDEAKSNGE